MARSRPQTLRYDGPALIDLAKLIAAHADRVLQLGVTLSNAPPRQRAVDLNYTAGVLNGLQAIDRLVKDAEKKIDQKKFKLAPADFEEAKTGKPPQPIRRPSVMLVFDVDEESQPTGKMEVVPLSETQADPT